MLWTCHQEIAILKTRKTWIERAEREGLSVQMSGKRRARKIDIIGSEDQAVDVETHAACSLGTGDARVSFHQVMRRFDVPRQSSFQAIAAERKSR
jgi:hypothetical protein